MRSRVVAERDWLIDHRLTADPNHGRTFSCTTCHALTVVEASLHRLSPEGRSQLDNVHVPVLAFFILIGEGPAGC